MKIKMYPWDQPSNWLSCNCGNFAEAHVVCEGVDDTRTYLDAEYSGDFYYSVSTYKILRCPLCDGVTIFRYTRHRNENYPEDEYDLIEYDKEILSHPPRIRHNAIPGVVAEVISQAESVASSSPRAAFILCRAALEEICRERGIPDTINKKGKSKFSSLNERLNVLFQKENLGLDLQGIMHGIRDLGNQGAHGSQVVFTEIVSDIDVEILLDLLDYVLERLYVDSNRTEEAKKKLIDLRNKVFEHHSDPSSHI